MSFDMVICFNFILPSTTWYSKWYFPFR